MGKSEEMLPSCPHVKLMSRYKDDPTFQRNLRLGLVELLSAVRDRVAKTWANKPEMTPTHIVLSIPAIWGADFEAKYSNIVMAVFHVGKKSVSFVNESDAIIHGMSRDEDMSEILFEDIPDETHSAIVLLDFGGHSLVSCSGPYRKLCHGEDSLMKLS